MSGSWTFDFRASSTGQTLSTNMSITMNGSNVELSSPQFAWGYRETRGEPIAGYISGNELTATWNEPPKPTDLECPTCAWTITLTGVVSSDGKTISGTYQKVGSGGEGSQNVTFIGTKL